MEKPTIVSLVQVNFDGLAQLVIELNRKVPQLDKKEDRGYFDWTVLVEDHLGLLISKESYVPLFNVKEETWQTHDWTSLFVLLRAFLNSVKD